MFKMLILLLLPEYLKILLDYSDFLSEYLEFPSDFRFPLQGQCKANAIERARIAEPQPVLAFSNANLRQIILALCPKRFRVAQSGSKGSKKVHRLRPL